MHLYSILIPMLFCGACATPTFNITCSDQYSLIGRRSYSIVTTMGQSRTIIWNRDSVDPGRAVCLVAEDLNQKGYEARISSKSDLLVCVMVFESNSKLDSKPTTILVDVYDRISQHKLWRGMAELSLRSLESGKMINNIELKDTITKLFQKFPKCKK